MRLSLLVAALAGAALLSGCATAHKGRTQRVAIDSRPSGATVLVDGRPVGRTPLLLDLSRQNGYQVTVRKRGFLDATDSIRTVPNEYAARFLRFGVDYSTGAMNDLSPARLSFALRPALLPTERGPDPYFEMATLVTEADSMRARGELNAADHRYVIERIIAYYRP